MDQLSVLAIPAGAPREDALRFFAQNVNKPGTIFSTEHWLQPKLAELRELLHDPLTADEATALEDVLHQRHWMADLLLWKKLDAEMSWEGSLTHRKAIAHEHFWARHRRPCVQYLEPLPTPESPEEPLPSEMFID